LVLPKSFDFALMGLLGLFYEKGVTGGAAIYMS